LSQHSQMRRFEMLEASQAVKRWAVFETWRRRDLCG
jgi:hypothetical protein